MEKLTDLENLADRLSARLGNNYKVYTAPLKIFVTIPDSDTNKQLKFIEITKLLSELNNGLIKSIYLKLQYLDEEETGIAAHRQIVDSLRMTVIGAVKVEYNHTQIEVSLPDDNDNTFVEKSLLVLKIIQKSVEDDGIILKDTILIRIKRSYREIYFGLQPDNTCTFAQYGKVSLLQLKILYNLCNSVADKFYNFKASNFGVITETFSRDIENLELKEFIEVDYDFSTLTGFVDEGEITEPEYPESFNIKLVNKEIVSKLHE